MELIEEVIKKGIEKSVTKRPIRYLAEYNEHISIAIKHILKTDKVWYRGVSNKGYDLTPSIYRKTNYSIEIEAIVRDEFMDKARGFFNTNSLSKYEWYYLMQHFGLPTRLLDWTEGYLIALFFSLQLGPKDNERIDPCVWIINPLELNDLSIGKKELIRTDFKGDGHESISSKYLVNSDLSIKENYPIAISSTYSNERILRQKGCFTIHGKDRMPIESVYRRKKVPNIVQLVIDRKKVKEIKKELLHSGISESSIFPDLEGLSRELVEKHF